MYEIDFEILERYSVIESDLNELTPFKLEVFSDIGKEIINNGLKNKDFTEIITGLFILEKINRLKKSNLTKIIKKIYLFNEIDLKIAYLVEKYHFLDLSTAIIYISVMKRKNYFKKLDFNQSFLDKNKLGSKGEFINFISAVIENGVNQKFLCDFLDKNQILNLNYLDFMLNNQTCFNLSEKNKKLNIYYFLIIYKNSYYSKEEIFIYLKLDSILEFVSLSNEKLDFILDKFFKSLEGEEEEKLKILINNFFQSNSMEKDANKREKLIELIEEFNSLKFDIPLLSQLPNKILFIKKDYKIINWKEKLIRDIGYKNNEKVFFYDSLKGEDISFLGRMNKLISLGELSESDFLIRTNKKRKSTDVLLFKIKGIEIDDLFYENEIKPIILEFIKGILIVRNGKYHEVVNNSYFYKS